MAAVFDLIATRPDIGQFLKLSLVPEPRGIGVAVGISLPLAEIYAFV